MSLACASYGEGAPAFTEWLTFDPATQSGKPVGIHPVILHDFDGDGLTEIFSGGSNAVVEYDGKAALVGRLLLNHWERTHEAGIVADFNGDTFVDYLAPSVNGDLLIYRGQEGGVFADPPLGKAKDGGPLQQPTAMTAGDIDQDGDLDLWVGQYRISYLMGMMPSPYYDAADGFPSFLLENKGNGTFAPKELPGLEKKRNRRTYTGTFVDLDDDRDLDLLVVSDFAGIDVYENDGKGDFTDVTDTWIDERHLFGMSATFGDYNMDGQLDFYVAGMGSTTARRLEFMRAERTDSPDVEQMRMKMAYGNRMYLRNPPLAGKGYSEPVFKDAVARTGWAWGTTTLDFDNDGDSDIFVANGHSSGASTKDHCTQFWCHDIYNPSVKPNKALHDAFQIVHRGYFDKTESWDGYQKSNLLMNIEGASFQNVAFLMGVADQFDGRAALSDDFDGDGRMDLVVVEDRWQKGQVLHVYRNTLETGHHWAGVRLRDTAVYGSPLGAKISVTSGGSTRVASIMAGETIHGQHSTSAHFGLGKNSKVESIEVLWPNGLRTKLENPKADTWYQLPE
ncbi:MAG: CRTAC1 family protein [Verrucomicrobiales bacterium]